MNPPVKEAMQPAEFRAWRERMGWTLTQAGYVLMVTKTSAAAYESGLTPIDGHIAHLCESAELLRTFESGLFSGNALDVIQHHHAKLRARMDEAETIGRAPPSIKFRPVPYKTISGYFVLATWPDGSTVNIDDNSKPGPAFKDEAGALKWIEKDSASWLREQLQYREGSGISGMSEDDLKAIGHWPKNARASKSMRFTKPTKR